MDKNLIFYILPRKIIYNYPQLSSARLTLRVVNTLRGNKILIGQVLEVPNAAEVGPTAEVGLKKKNHEPVIRISGSSFFVALGGIVVHSFNIENKDHIAYKDIKVRVRYFSNVRTEVGSKH